MGKAQANGGKRRVKIKKACKVFSLGRNTTVGEIVEVSDADARFLVNNRYAERAAAEVAEVAEVAVVEPEPIEEVTEEVTDEDVSFEPEVSEEAADEDEGIRRFPGRRRRG